MSEIRFEKVSYEQFKKDYLSCNSISDSAPINDSYVRSIYDNIKIPERKTKFSAGYDFAIPYDVYLGYGTCAAIPTGIRCKMDDNLVLMIYPRSSIGFKYRVGLANTVGIIDADYYNAENEGHIIIKLVREEAYEKMCKMCTGDDVTGHWRDFSDLEKYMECTLEAGSNFVQGVFSKFITGGEIVDQERTGGIGSTSDDGIETNVSKY